MKKIGSLVKVDWNDFVWEIENFWIMKGRLKAVLIHKFPHYKENKWKHEAQIGLIKCTEFADKLIVI